MGNTQQNISYYQTCLRLHKCVRCGSQDARTLIGKPLCFDCLKKKSEEMRGYDQTESNRKSYEKAIANGMCIRCRKRKTDGIYKTCTYCRATQKKKYYEKKAQTNKLTRHEAKENGICSLCCSRPILPGRNTCEQCYTSVVNRLKGSQHKNKLGYQISKEMEVYKNVKEQRCNP